MNTFFRIICTSIFNAFWFTVSGVGALIGLGVHKVFIAVGAPDPTAWAITVGLLFAIDVAFCGAAAVEDRESEELKAIAAEKIALDKQKAEFITTCDEFRSEQQQAEADFRRLLSETKQNSPWLAGQIADFEYLKDIKIAQKMRTKSHPALTSAQQVSEIAKEKRILQKQLKTCEYQISFLEALFPWLPGFEQISVKEAVTYARETESGYDNMRDYLSPEEYSKLSSAEKSDLALKRWKSKKRGEWEAGRDYERYIGYKYEADGYKVEYVGALLGKEDRGIDLIAEKGKEVKIIQCKRYSSVKNHFVHENTVAQLFGATAVHNMENPNSHAEGVIYTSSKLSDEAKRFAEYLKINVIENELLRDYPMIKCNLGKSGEKIYHLPFDQQYDKIIISGKKQSCYVSSAVEAERLGYRRAYRWKGN